MAKTRKKFKKFTWMPRNKTLLKLMNSPIGVVCINWVFQGILGMAPTDLWFKIGLEVVLILVGVVVFISFVPLNLALLFSFFTAHTLNWLLDGHFFVVGRYVGFTSTSADRIWSYTRGIAQRANRSPFLLGTAMFGSVTRGEALRSTSDVDLRFIRRPGWINGFRAAWFTFMERARALFGGFPLDPYLLDDLRGLEKMRADEKPILLHDPDGVLQAYYAQKGYAWLETRSSE